MRVCAESDVYLAAPRPKVTASIERGRFLLVRPLSFRTYDDARLILAQNRVAIRAFCNTGVQKAAHVEKAIWHHAFDRGHDMHAPCAVHSRGGDVSGYH